MHHMCHREVHSGGHYSYGYGQKINAVTQVSQQKTKVTKNFSKNLLCYKKSILQ
jgi:hypothetical protein